MDVFVSVGTGLSPAQGEFVAALESRLRLEGMVPRTLGRSDWSTLAPLASIEELMASCGGAIILGLERYYFDNGIERRGSIIEKQTGNISLVTPWNQIEATIAHTRGLPLFVLIDEHVKAEGLLEAGHDWHVARININKNPLGSDEFIGMLHDFTWRVKNRGNSTDKLPPSDLSKFSIKDLLAMCRPSELWALAAVLTTIIAGALALGVTVSPLLGDRAAPATSANSGQPALPRGSH